MARRPVPGSDLGMDDDEKRAARKEFDEAVNMTPAELKKWLATDESSAVGQKNGGGESVGHHSGRRIIEIKQTKVADLGDADYEHMSKVVGYVARHSKQRPNGDVSDTPWRFSLMNWGHDPTK
jgi:hypothetical protein